MSSPRGMLITVHGLYSHAKWNMTLAPLATHQGWVYAPYIYDHNNARLLLNPYKRKQALQVFTNWLGDLQATYPYPISILAHSYGTYLVAAYLQALKGAMRFNIDAIIFAGSIVTPHYDWPSLQGQGVGAVLNITSPKDQWVKFLAREHLQKHLHEPLMGDSGLSGFVHTGSGFVSHLSEPRFDHYNVLGREVIEGHLMPFFNAHLGKGQLN